jgi:hypothetical protein
VGRGLVPEVMRARGAAAQSDRCFRLGGSSRALGGMLIRLRWGGRRLGFYHEKKDEARNIGLGPEHMRAMRLA